MFIHGLCSCSGLNNLLAALSEITNDILIPIPPDSMRDAYTQLNEFIEEVKGSL